MVEKFDESLLYLARSVKILKKLTNKRISDRKMKDFFKKACGNKNGNFVYKNDKGEYNKIHYYLRVFKIQVEPTFLKNSFYKDEKYGYCLVVETEEYILINSRHCNLAKKNLLGIGCEIPSTEFSTLLADNGAEVDRMKIYNAFDTKPNIRARDIQGNGLESNYTPNYLSRNVLSALIFRIDQEKYSQSLNRGRITEISNKIEIVDFLKWCDKLVHKFLEHEPLKYLGNFAQCVKYEDEKEKLEPDVLLFKLSYLNSERYKLKDENNNNIENIDSIIVDYSEGIKLLKSEKENVYKSKDEQIVVKKLKHKISINIKTEKDILVVDMEENIEVPLIEILNDSVVVLFKDIRYSYIPNSLYIDNYLISNENSFLENFIGIDGMENITTEKGNVLKKKQVEEFDEDSLFYSLKNYIYDDYDYIICDDLGNEVADFIGCSNDKISFFHAKASSHKFSASAFQEVVGQALKNIHYLSNVRNINLGDGEQAVGTDKSIFWKGYYSKTAIPRLIKPKDVGTEQEVDSAIEMLKKANKSNQTVKKMVLVVNFISKEDLAMEIKNETKAELKQIIWLLSNFIATCQESNIIPQILCKK